MPDQPRFNPRPKAPSKNSGSEGRAARLPWRGWFQFAVLSLGLAPEEFWGLTLDEWRFLAPDDAAALDRRGLNRLIALYPDHQK